ncbi:IPT/TIG domain-containing protein [Streptomyces sioyaensis]|uniref:IPT/TIG domain-containing protein n=1 Tax=Streptomyces sioyaensis TaxID=67364 RepID=UPI00340A3FFE
MPLSPNQGSTGGNTTVTITSTTPHTLSTISKVMFGSNPATNVIYHAVPDNVTCTSPAGAGVVQVRAVLTNGQTSNGVPFYYIGAPFGRALSPTHGPLASGTTVTITGIGLDTTTGVSFATNAATVTSRTDGQVVVTAPAGAAGAVSVNVTTAAGTFDGLSYTYVANPGTLTLAPTSGPISGGTSVAITATGNVTTTSQVLFGATSLPFSVTGTNRLAVITPSHALGAVNVQKMSRLADQRVSRS